LEVGPVGHKYSDERDYFLLPFGYYLERNEDLLVLRRADGSDVARFGAVGVDPFEVEFAVWEDAD
jgi:hypothetical protein